MKEELYYYWLDNVPGIGRITMRRLIEVISPRELYEQGAGAPGLPLREKQRKQLDEHRQRWRLEEEWEGLREKGIHFCCMTSRDYPDKLRNIPDPPVVLYQKGEVEHIHRTGVAVVGTRNCSAYGTLAAKELGRALADQGIVVISGMARGIDGISQWAALEQGGASVGVLGCGVEICYPRENRFLYERLQESGCLLSESSPYTQPHAGLFPSRNRLISGLAEVLVVIEAKEKSGSLITVDMALEQGKEVYAMPGRITDSVSRGCNVLIKQGAELLLSPREFAGEMGKLLMGKKAEEKKEESPLTLQEKELYGLLEPLPLSVEAIWQKARRRNPGLTLSQVMEGLLMLVMKGQASTHEQYFYRSHLG